jgi:hypothetical protein
MEKKYTRDQALIMLLHENEVKDARIKVLEKEIKNENKSTTKRLRKLEEDMRRLLNAVKETERKTRVLTEKSSSLENSVSGVQQEIRRRK